MSCLVCGGGSGVAPQVVFVVVVFLVVVACLDPSVAVVVFLDSF